ncbi:MAG: hypothetical protein ABI779_05140 [Acidobacteriota bacterium]
MFEELPGWSFDEREVSAGVYVVFAQHVDGRRIEMTGTDPDALIEKLKTAADVQLRSS